MSPGCAIVYTCFVVLSIVLTRADQLGVNVADAGGFGWTVSTDIGPSDTCPAVHLSAIQQ